MKIQFIMSQSKMTNAQFTAIRAISPIVESNDTVKKDEIKYALLTLIQNALGEDWYSLRKNTQNALQYLCMLSVEQGFFFCGHKHLEEKFGIKKSTVYNILRKLQDCDILFKKNRTPSSHNGKGNAVYMFVNHPSFKVLCDLLDTEWKANWKAEWKAESAQTPCESKAQEDFLTPTYSLPISLSLSPNSNLSNHHNVSTEVSTDDGNLSTTPVDKSHSNNQKWCEFVPKPINIQFFSTLKDKLLPIWRKITSAFKSVKLSTLNKTDKVRKAHEVLRYLVNTENYGTMSLDKMCAYVYKGMRDGLYNMIGFETLADMDIIDKDESYYMNVEGDMVRTSLTAGEMREERYKEVKKRILEKLSWSEWLVAIREEEQPYLSTYAPKHNRIVIDQELESCLY